MHTKDNSNGIRSIIALITSLTLLCVAVCPQTSFAETEAVSPEAAAENNGEQKPLPDSTWWRMGLMIGGAGLIFGGMALIHHSDGSGDPRQKWGIALCSTGFVSFIGGILAPLFD